VPLQLAQAVQLCERHVTRCRPAALRLTVNLGEEGLGSEWTGGGGIAGVCGLRARALPPWLRKRPGLQCVCVCASLG
jgi:hypothetical protein